MNTNENRSSFEIVSGPSRDTLFDACKYAYDKSAHVGISFGIPVAWTAPPTDLKAMFVPMEMEDIIVSLIPHEDGSGNSFNISGYCKAALVMEGRLKDYEFKAYYNTKTRQGVIEFR